MNFLHNQIFLCVQFSLCEVKNWESVDYKMVKIKMICLEMSEVSNVVWTDENSRLDNGKATMEQ